MAQPKQPLKGASDGFEGDMAGLGLADVIQLNAQNHFSGCVTVQNGESRGLVFFRDGEIIHVEQGESVGEEAFCDILEWPTGRFSSQPNLATTRSTIQKAWQHLLLDAYRQLDERRAARQGKPPPIRREAPARPAGAGGIIEKLRRIAGVAYAVVQTKDGVRVEDDSYEGETLAGQAVYLAMVGKRLGSVLQTGEVNSAAVQGAGRHLLLFAAKSHYLSILVQSESQVGAVEAEVRKVLAASR